MGPILFVTYMADLVLLVAQYTLSAHVYVDDTQVHGSCPPSDVSSSLTQICTCCTCGRRLDAGQPSVLEMRQDGLHVDDHQPKSVPTSSLGTNDRLDLGASRWHRERQSVTPAFFIDADLSMRRHVQRTVSRCFSSLR